MTYKQGGENITLTTRNVLFFQADPEWEAMRTWMLWCIHTHLGDQTDTSNEKAMCSEISSSVP